MKEEEEISEEDTGEEIPVDTEEEISVDTEEEISMDMEEVNQEKEIPIQSMMKGKLLRCHICDSTKHFCINLPPSRERQKNQT